MELTVENVCKSLNVNQKELAEITGYSIDTVSKWNRGVNKIPKSAINHFRLLIENKNYKKIDPLLKEIKDLTI